VKKLLLIISLVLIGFVANAQTPDTLQLSPKELFGESDDWNDVGILQSYVNFSKDVLSSSNLSVGIIGRQVSTTLNLGYHKSSMNGQWGHSFAASINPIWKWEGKYTVNENGDFVDLIYPQMPASSELTYRGMVMYTYTLKTKRVDISPQIFAMSDIYKTFKDGETDISYFSKFNLDLYYGTSIDWKVTKRFVLNSNIRYNTTFDKSSQSVGYKKANPIMFMIGTNFQF